jgi:hypothetical protein
MAAAEVLDLIDDKLDMVFQSPARVARVMARRAAPRRYAGPASLIDPVGRLGSTCGNDYREVLGVKVPAGMLNESGWA